MQVSCGRDKTRQDKTSALMDRQLRDEMRMRISKEVVMDGVWLLGHLNWDSRAR